jgi:hypothetical protein
MFTEQRVRAILFYLSLTIFLAGLPFILSFALGYKFDRRTFKFTKTGMIVLKTQPAGAGVYLESTLLEEKTPITLNELLPGTYNLKIALEHYYPWNNVVKVEAGKVSRLDKIILFPLRSNVMQLNKEPLLTFWVDEENKTVYYINQDGDSVCSSDIEGGHYDKLASLAPIVPAALRFKLSPDKTKLIHFNKHQLGIVVFPVKRDQQISSTSFILNYPDSVITDVFWHSDSFHLILVAEKKIEVLEARPGSPFLGLVNLNHKTHSISYDLSTDALYFTDYQKADDGNFYNNLYKLELNTRAFQFQDLMKLKSAKPMQEVEP